MEYWEDFSLSKVLSLVDQSLLDRLVPRQHNHLLICQGDSEHWTIFIGELTEERGGEVNTMIRMEPAPPQSCSSQNQEGSYLGEVAVKAFEIQLVQVSQQRKSSRSWQLFSLVSGDEAEAKLEQQQAQNSHHQVA